MRACRTQNKRREDFILCLHPNSLCLDRIANVCLNLLIILMVNLTVNSSVESNLIFYSNDDLQLIAADSELDRIIHFTIHHKIIGRTDECK